MSRTLPDITIAIKTFERRDSLRSLIESVRLFYPDISILIADDSRKPYAKEIASLFSDVEYILLPFDVGLSAGRNAMLKHVRTKYFVLCDDDFLFYEQTKLEDFKKILDENDVELIAGCVMDKSETGKFDLPNEYAGNFVLGENRHLYMQVVPPAKPFVRCDIVPNWFMANTEAVRKKTGGWDSKLKIEEHTDFFWRAKKGGLKVASTAEVKVNHTVARSHAYHYFRQTRVNQYFRYYFRKLGITGFTDRWETVNLKDVQPRWFKFIFEQKCIPWFVTTRWRALKSYIGIWRSFETIDLERTYVGDFKVESTVEEIVESKGYMYNSVLLKDSRHVRFLNMFKDRTDVSDEEIRKTKYYKAEFGYVAKLAYGETEAMNQCRNFLSLYQIFRNARCWNKWPLFGCMRDGCSQNSMLRVFKVLNSDKYMILDGHHRLACHYILGHRYIKVCIVGIKKNLLQVSDLN